MSIFKYFGKKPDTVIVTPEMEKMIIHHQVIYQAFFSLDLDSKSTKMSYQMLSTLRTLQQLVLQLEGSVKKDSRMLIILVK